MRRWTIALAFGRLIEPTELRFSILWCRLFAGRDDANYFTGRRPFYVITRLDVVFFHDSPGHSDLVFGCDFSHNLLRRILSLP